MHDSTLDQIYGDTSLALMTDLYQLTMAYGYWKQGMQDREATFTLYFRKHPFGGNYTVACGTRRVLEYLDRFKFTDDDIEYLRSLRAGGGQLFADGFLDYLKELRLGVRVEAVLEGTIVHPKEPLVKVHGPLLQGQILETPLLNIMNFETLIATKASRIVQAAKGRKVIEFGLRRAQGLDGALSASRAAMVGGCSGTSNVMAGKVFGVPIVGTHAHSWVMAFEEELDAFDAYVASLPDNYIMLVDTYDTMNGVEKAIAALERAKNLSPDAQVGIRLDSGSLAHLSIDARKRLNAAGLNDAVIVASDDLDEERIKKMLEVDKAEIDVFGVGTNLVTAKDQPALGGVYKLTRIEAGSSWRYPAKRSEDAMLKATIPGDVNVRRYVCSLKKDSMDVLWETNKSNPLSDKALVCMDPKAGTPVHTPTSGVTSVTELLHTIYESGTLWILDREDLTIERACKRREDGLREIIDGDSEYTVLPEAALFALTAAASQEALKKGGK